MKKTVGAAVLVAVTLAFSACARADDAPSVTASPVASPSAPVTTDAASVEADSSTPAAGAGGGHAKPRSSSVAGRESSEPSDTGECIQMGLSVEWKPGDEVERNLCVKVGAGIQVKLNPEADGRTWQHAASSVTSVAAVTAEQTKGSATILTITAKAPGKANVSAVSAAGAKKAGNVTWVLHLTVKG